MPRPATKFWTPERDQRLRDMREARKRAPEIATALGCSLFTVERRITDLGLALAMPAGQYSQTLWTPERDERLRDLMAQVNPQLTLAQICDAFGREISLYSLRTRAISLGLLKQSRPSRAGKDCKPKAADAGAKPAPPACDAEPCPYFDPYAKPKPETGKIERCGVIVDRRLRPDGSRPPQYCKDHQHRVTPIGGEGSRAGMRVLPVTRAGILGLL